MKKLVFFAGKCFKNQKWFRNSYLGFIWFINFHSENGTDEYLLWQTFNIK